MLPKLHMINCAPFISLSPSSTVVSFANRRGFFDLFFYGILKSRRRKWMRIGSCDVRKKIEVLGTEQ